MLAPLAVKVVVPPAQADPVGFEINTVGVGLTVTSTVYTPEQVPVTAVTE